MTSLAVRRPVASWLRVGVLLVGFGAAIELRVAIGGVTARDSVLAGVVFAIALTGLAWAVGIRLRVDVRSVVVGLVAAAALCAPVALQLDVGRHRPAGAYAPWALVVVAVALAEEAFLRGALFDAVRELAGPWAAILVGAVGFAALHVPLYGVASVPLDFAVGLLLGALRWACNSWLAPGVAHAAADLAGWWLR